MTNVITIARTKELPDRTLGVLYFNDTVIGSTVEQPWRDNMKNQSCIPKGEYDLYPHDSVKHGQVVAFYNPTLDVYLDEDQIPPGKQGRSECLIHEGNFVTDVEGCVAVGNQIVEFQNKGLGVNKSIVTLNKLRELWGNRHNLKAVIK